MERLFFELIRVAIGNAVCLSHTPTAKEWNELYAMAKKQSLVGICFAGVQRLQMQQQTPPEQLYLQWMGMAAKIQQRNETVNRQCAELAESLKLKGYRCCVLKGQGIASLYKLRAESLEARENSLNHKPSTINLQKLRQSGDIDVWMEGGAEKVIDAVMKIAPTKDIERKHIALNVFDSTEVEVHWVPSELDNPFTNKRLRAWYESEAERQFSNVSELGFCTPTAEFNAVYLLLHIYEHFLYEGVGLRQLTDYYLVLQAAQVRAERLELRENLLRLLDSFGLLKFAGAVMYVLQKVFGMNENEMLMAVNAELGKVLLDDIMEGGNFGKHGKDGGRGNEGWCRWAMRRAKRTLRLWRYEPIGALCRPFIRLRLFFWTKGIYKKYNLK